jgi:hypothetical protein
MEGTPCKMPEDIFAYLTVLINRMPSLDSLEPDRVTDRPPEKPRSAVWARD